MPPRSLTASSLNLAASNSNPTVTPAAAPVKPAQQLVATQLVARGRAARQQQEQNQSADQPQPSSSTSNSNLAPKENSEKTSSDSDSSSTKNGRKRPESGSPPSGQRASKRGRRDSTATEVSP